MRLISCLPLVSLLAVAMTAWSPAAAGAASRPNVVLIVSDDMGYADLPGFGMNMGIPMPQMDRLRTGGVSFTNAYASAPICVVSRMGMYTGRNQARWGVYENVYDGNPAYIKFQREKTIASYFKEAGYATSLVGKWHLSGNGNILDQPPDFLPDAKGFDEITIIPGGMSSYQPGTLLYRKGGSFIPAPEHLTDYFGHLAADFIQRKKDEPFFLLLAFNAVHAPLHALEKDIEEFGSLKGYDSGTYVPELAVANRNVRRDREVYSGMMRAFDRNIGRVLDALSQAGVSGETLVVYVNDNGGPALDTPVHSYNEASNLPYRGGKFDCLEGGIRVPMVISWPGHIPTSRRYGTFTGLTSSLDILPTVLAACGISAPKDRPLDGTNLIPFLNQTPVSDPHNSLCWQGFFLDEKNTGQAAIRQGKWKLHQYASVVAGPRLEDWALYDLTADPGEKRDLSRDHPGKVKELDDDWRKWKAEMQPLALAKSK
ncbi:MAG: sulfatase-like hydrolase/transferase [Opitutaceae bacterium]|nr:sulfatase-like hydrolase/transferase [Opitutaceae bacterium]